MLNREIRAYSPLAVLMPFVTSLIAGLRAQKYFTCPSVLCLANLNYWLLIISSCALFLYFTGFGLIRATSWDRSVWPQL